MTRGSLPGGVCVHGGFLSIGFLSIGFLSIGFLSRAVSVQGVSVQGVSVQGVSIWGGLHPGGVSVRETPPDRDPPVRRVHYVFVTLNVNLRYYRHCDTWILDTLHFSVQLQYLDRKVHVCSLLNFAQIGSRSSQCQGY